MSNNPSKTTDPRCGSCIYWQPISGEPDFGDCLWAGPVPIWITDKERHDSMMATDGRKCPTYARKGSST